MKEEEFKTGFEKFINDLQWRKDFDGESQDHYHSAMLIFMSVYSIGKDHDRNLEGAFKNVNLANLIGSLLDEGWLIEEIATEAYVQPTSISLYYEQDTHIFYAVVRH